MIAPRRPQFGGDGGDAVGLLDPQLGGVAHLGHALGLGRQHRQHGAVRRSGAGSAARRWWWPARGRASRTTSATGSPCSSRACLEQQAPRPSPPARRAPRLRVGFTPTPGHAQHRARAPRRRRQHERRRRNIARHRQSSWASAGRGLDLDHAPALRRRTGAPIASNIARYGRGWARVRRPRRPSANRPASSTADLICALGTGVV